VILFFVVACASPALAQTAYEPPSQDIALTGGLSVAEAEARIDQAVDALWPWLVERQDAYYDRVSRGKYFQVLSSHLKVPSNGRSDYPDGWFLRPTDQQYRLADARAVRYERMPYAFRLDTYSGPEGEGWVFCYSVRLTGRLYEKCRQYGPETARETDWQEIGAE
jgi:hypothetical protein